MMSEGGKECHSDTKHSNGCTMNTRIREELWKEDEEYIKWRDMNVIIWLENWMRDQMEDQRKELSELKFVYV